MTKYLLDTNIVSNATKPEPSEPLVSWMVAQESADLFIASLTLAEIWRGILQKPAGAKRDALELWFRGPSGPQVLFAGRVLPFDEKASLVWAQLMAEGFASGAPRSGLDTIIAATALSNDCTVVTGNVRHFSGVAVLNPMGT